MKPSSKVLTGVLAFSMLGLLPSQSQAKAPDLLVELDQTVLSLHDFSVVAAQLAKETKPEVNKATNSALNKILGDIRTKITKFDKDLNTSWLYIGADANDFYPGRMTFKDFDLQVFKWYNFQLNLQKQVVDCYKNLSTSNACAIGLRAKNVKTEKALYGNISDTLKYVETWRKTTKR